MINGVLKLILPSYFLTVNPAGGNLQIGTRLLITLPAIIPAEPYFMHTAGNYYKDKINTGMRQWWENMFILHLMTREKAGHHLISEPMSTELKHITNLYPYTGAGSGARVESIMQPEMH